jgi:AraC-like DNA-binding protein
MSDATPPPAFLSLRASGRSATEFELWRWAMSPMFDADAASAEQRPEFECISHSYICRRMSVGSMNASALHFRRGSRELARGCTDQIMVVAYQRGNVALRADRRDLVVRPGDVMIVDLGRSTEILATPTSGTTFLLPRDSLEALTTSLDHIHGMILPTGDELNGLLTMQMQYALKNATAFTETQNVNLVQSMAHLLAAGIGEVDHAREPTAEAVAAARLRRVRKLIEANLGKADLGPATLTKLTGWSRASLYRMFEPLGGISAYILQRRMMQAHRDLINPALFHVRVGAIGQLAGFTEPATFSRAYKTHYGVLPSEARAHARQTHPSAARQRDGGDASLHTLNRWLSGRATSNL